MINWFSAAKLGHHFIAEKLQAGDTAVDGTMGNGHDTLILAQLVGPTGKVWAFDIQAQALANTRERLATAGVLDERIELIQDGHEYIKKYVSHPIQAAIYNLGYLPGGDHAIITLTETTLTAIRDTLDLLAAGGRMVVVVYPGHPGGDREKEAVEAYLARLDAREYKVLKCNFLNRPATAPGVILIEKGGGRN